MTESFLTPQQCYALWLGFAALAGMVVFLRLAAKEWGYREAWLRRQDAARRARKAVMQTHVAQHAQVAAAIERANGGFTVVEQGPAAGADGASRPASP